MIKYHVAIKIWYSIWYSIFFLFFLFFSCFNQRYSISRYTRKKLGTYKEITAGKYLPVKKSKCYLEYFKINYLEYFKINYFENAEQSCQSCKLPLWHFRREIMAFNHPRMLVMFFWLTLYEKESQYGANETRQVRTTAMAIQVNV